MFSLFTVHWSLYSVFITSHRLVPVSGGGLASAILDWLLSLSRHSLISWRWGDYGLWHCCSKLSCGSCGGWGWGWLWHEACGCGCNLTVVAVVTATSPPRPARGRGWRPGRGRGRGWSRRRPGRCCPPPPPCARWWAGAGWPAPGSPAGSRRGGTRTG